jgi:signal transduction histidine kinase
VQASGSCTILDLTLGPLHLDLLGLVVDLNQVHLTITAQQGPGNLLGNLLCAVANLLNGSGSPNALQQIVNLLNQILGNLFDNAVKYQMPGRPLNITARILPQGRGVVRVDVSDNGRGIAEDDYERIFELFRRAGEQDQQGEGIGLAHVRSLIRNLGGDITVVSELGKGSTFHLTLPTDLRKITRGSDI